MPNRTIQVLGNGYGSDTCNATCIFDGNLVFSGPIPTLNLTEPLLLANEQSILFSFEISAETHGTFPVSITFENGDFGFVEAITSNYGPVENPIFTTEQYQLLSDVNTTPAQRIEICSPLANPPFTSEELAILETGNQAQFEQIMKSRGLTVQISGGPSIFLPCSRAQAKNNIFINGVSFTIPNPLPPGIVGEWGYQVPIINNSGTTTFDLAINKAVL